MLIPKKGLEESSGIGMDFLSLNSVMKIKLVEDEKIYTKISHSLNSKKKLYLENDLPFRIFVEGNLNYRENMRYKSLILVQQFLIQPLLFKNLFTKKKQVLECFTYQLERTKVIRVMDGRSEFIQFHLLSNYIPSGSLIVPELMMKVFRYLKCLIGSLKSNKKSTYLRYLIIVIIKKYRMMNLDLEFASSTHSIHVEEEPDRILVGRFRSLFYSSNQQNYMIQTIMFDIGEKKFSKITNILEKIMVRHFDMLRQFLIKIIYDKFQ